jgi:hypothetical protein
MVTVALPAAEHEASGTKRREAEGEDHAAQELDPLVSLERL